MIGCGSGLEILSGVTSIQQATEAIEKMRHTREKVQRDKDTALRNSNI